MRHPLDRFIITQGYDDNHHGLDEEGSNEAKATADGIVYFIWRFNKRITIYDDKTLNNNGGNFVIIQTPFNNLWYYNGHLRDILVSWGQHITEGQILGHVGNTGYTLGPTGVHDHFEMRQGIQWEDRHYVNPNTVIQGGIIMPAQWEIDVSNAADAALDQIGLSDWKMKPLSEKCKVLIGEAVKYYKMANGKYRIVGQLYEEVK